DSRAGLRTFLRSRRARTGRFPLAGPYAVAFADRHGGLAVARGAGQPDTDVGGRLSGLAAQHSLEVGAFVVQEAHRAVQRGGRVLRRDEEEILGAHPDAPVVLPGRGA